MKTYDMVIIGGGIYGLYISTLKELKDKKKLIIEIEDKCFKRASYVNQARVHNGYHYPRDLKTSGDAHKYFDQFNKEFSYAINSSFKSIYAISNNCSLTSAAEFEDFCKKIGLPIEKEDPKKYFKENKVEAAYSTIEYTFDANKIRDELLKKSSANNTEIMYSTYVESYEIFDGKYHLVLNNKSSVETPLVINTTYSSINCVNKLFDIPLIDVKYELCEVITGKANEELQKYAFTIMDGSYFSTMPFSEGNRYSLTSVHFTPHETCLKELPFFTCQLKNEKCKCKQLQNCNTCRYRPLSKFNEMKKIFNEYLDDKFDIEYESSLFGVKPILKSSEEDDSRPTIIKKYGKKPMFVSCLSGKVSTIYIMGDFILNLYKEMENND